jgi:hypothetical protein
MQRGQDDGKMVEAISLRMLLGVLVRAAVPARKSTLPLQAGTLRLQASFCLTIFQQYSSAAALQQSALK